MKILLCLWLWMGLIPVTLPPEVDFPDLIADGVGVPYEVSPSGSAPTLVYFSSPFIFLPSLLAFSFLSSDFLAAFLFFLAAFFAFAVFFWRRLLRDLNSLRTVV